MPLSYPTPCPNGDSEKGESAVIASALDLRTGVVLDDRTARRCARALGLPLIGTLGVIVRAKQRGVIQAAAPIIRAVLDAGLYYGDEGVARLLAGIGEPWP
jgi:predicted nucleic acid-binding protein